MSFGYNIIVLHHYRILAEHSENRKMYYNVFHKAAPFSSSSPASYAACDAAAINIYGELEECE